MIRRFTNYVILRRMARLGLVERIDGHWWPTPDGWEALAADDQEGGNQASSNPFADWRRPGTLGPRDGARKDG